MMQWAFYDAFGILPAEVVKALGGQQPEISVPSQRPLKGRPNGPRRQRATLKLLRRIWNYPSRVKPLIESHLDHERSFEATNWATLSRDRLRQTMAQIMDAQNRIAPVAGLANSCSGPWQLALDGLVKDPDLIARLQAGARGVTSAEQGYRLYDIARGESPMQAFLHEFGHRAVYEADLLNPRWAEDPSWLLEQVNSIRQDPPPRDPRETAAEVRRSAEQELKHRFGWRTALLLWLVRKLRDGMTARESAKSALVSLMLPVRRILLEIGRRLVAGGHLTRPSRLCIWQLSMYRAGCGVIGTVKARANSHATALIAARRGSSRWLLISSQKIRTGEWPRQRQMLC